MDFMFGIAIGAVIGFYFGMSYMRKTVERELMKLVDEYKSRVE